MADLRSSARGRVRALLACGFAPLMFLVVILVDGALQPGYNAMLEVGRAQRTVFLSRRLRDRDLQRETESGLNVVENHNGVNDHIKRGKRGEASARPPEHSET
ncbi:transposase [Streptosporangium pseudovulgare]|uniref:Tn3 transposase DDE domain-containing protein n=1 Tax=Streptosporangium pseudovulgare TaxID=35765 RepID=A0ABQ2RC18_9ACTN|nr:transposase [Streptosporangium pseudovulgare]GGQ20259.1 hypothetical protein GCM10010140_58350 [Streptosporangium pseudovulgare]